MYIYTYIHIHRIYSIVCIYIYYVHMYICIKYIDTGKL